MKSEATLREKMWRFAKYCNAISPRKLNDPKDPIVGGAINDFADQILKLIEAEKLEARLEQVMEDFADICLNYSDQIDESELIKWRLKMIAELKARKGDE